MRTSRILDTYQHRVDPNDRDASMAEYYIVREVRRCPMQDC